MKKDIRVVELFAGVGGFRLGLEAASDRFKTVWANQWEPGTKSQHAFEVYDEHFKNTSSKNVNEDISKVWQDVPAHDLLVGGFPCQDYSVAQGNRAQGINGKKGVLWWQIYNIVEKRKPKMLLLENVDRLLNSPSSQRGRDFAIMLRSLNDLGYAVEWRVVTASDYGFAQSRTRVFIHAYKSTRKSEPKLDDLKNSIFEKAFPSKDFSNFKTDNISKDIYADLVEVTDNYGDGKFWQSGISINGRVFSAKYEPKYSGKTISLRDVLDSDKNNFEFLTDAQREKAEFTKASKKLKRTTKDGFEYNYTEGQMSFPDALDKPGRTMLTSEGSINRSSHFIGVGKKVRFLTPVEAERLNGFPDNWTKSKTNKQRYFFMGNALVVDVIKKLGKEIAKEEK